MCRRWASFIRESERLSCPKGAQAISLISSSACHDQTNDQALKPECIGENQDQDHTNEEARLLRVGANASVTTDANGQARRKRAHAHSEPCSQVRVSCVRGIFGRLVDFPVDDNRGDETVYAQYASHYYWDDAAHDHVWAHDAHGRDADAGFGGAVSGAEVCEHYRRRHNHEAKEGGGGVARSHGGGGEENLAQRSRQGSRRAKTAGEQHSRSIQQALEPKWLRRHERLLLVADREVNCGLIISTAILPGGDRGASQRLVGVGRAEEVVAGARRGEGGRLAGSKAGGAVNPSPLLSLRAGPAFVAKVRSHDECPRLGGARPGRVG